MRITPAELKAKLDSEEDVLVVDRVPRDRDIVLYCTWTQRGLQRMD